MHSNLAILQSGKHKPMPQNLWCRQIYQIPIINVLGMRQVEINALLLQGLVFFGVLEDLHQGQQGGQAHLVVFGGDAGLKVLEGGCGPALLHHLAGQGHLDAQELVALAVLALPRLEEARQAFNLGRVSVGKDFRI